MNNLPICWHELFRSRGHTQAATCAQQHEWHQFQLKLMASMIEYMRFRTRAHALSRAERHQFRSDKVFGEEEVGLGDRRAE
jgi:hypothetical protein